MALFSERDIEIEIMRKENVAVLERKQNGSRYILMIDPNGSATSWVPKRNLVQSLENGFAIARPEDVDEVGELLGSGVVDFGDLSGKTKPELVAVGVLNGVEMNMKMTKDEMIVALEGN